MGGSKDAHGRHIISSLEHWPYLRGYMADQETKEIKCLLLHRLILCVFHDIRFKLTGYTPRLREVGRYFFALT